MLFLPAMFYHHVMQDGREEDGLCVAVNFWYDMTFDDRFCVHAFVMGLAETAFGEAAPG